MIRYAAPMMLVLLTGGAAWAEDATVVAPAPSAVLTPVKALDALGRVTPISVAMNTEASRRLAPMSAGDHRAKIIAAAQTLRTRADAPPPRDTKPKSLDLLALEVAAPISIGGHDVDSLLFLVMMAAAKSAQDDLKSLLADMKATNAAKKKCRTRACVASLKPTAEYDRATLDKLLTRLENQRDSLSELSASEALQLQLAMDRYSKFMTTLSNVMKKASDSSTTVIQNLK